MLGKGESSLKKSNRNKVAAHSIIVDDISQNRRIQRSGYLKDNQEKMMPVRS